MVIRIFLESLGIWKWLTTTQLKSLFFMARFTGESNNRSIETKRMETALMVSKIFNNQCRKIASVLASKIENTNRTKTVWVKKSWQSNGQFWPTTYRSPTPWQSIRLSHFLKKKRNVKATPALFRCVLRRWTQWVKRNCFVCLFVCLFVLLDGSPFGLLRPLQDYGKQDRGTTVVLGEMDAARVNPHRVSQGRPPVHSALFRPRRPTAVTQFRGRYEICRLPGGRHPPGPDYEGHRGIEEDVRRGQKRDRMNEITKNIFLFLD